MAFAFSQSKASGSNAASQTLTFDSNVGAGSLIAVALRDGGGATSMTVSDDRGSTYALARQTAAGSGTTLLYVGITTSGGSCSVSVSGGSATFTRITITEFTTALTSTTPDATNAATATTASPLNTGTVTPANATALILAVISAQSDITYTGAGTGWTLGPVGFDRLVLAHRIVSSVAAYSADFAWSSGAADVGAVIAAFSESGGGGASNAPRSMFYHLQGMR